MDLKTYQAVVGSTASEFAATGLEYGLMFQWQVMKMNQMYSLPINHAPTLDGLGESPLKRMQGFMKTLQKEMDEGQEILFMLSLLEAYERNVGLSINAVNELAAAHDIGDKRLAVLVGDFRNALFKDSQRVSPATDFAPVKAEFKDEAIEDVKKLILVMLSDWLGDMDVYNRSEALKYGIPLESVKACIMGSNFTKLGAGGEVIKDANGKVQKGPNFMPPEAHIYATLFGAEELAEEANNELDLFAVATAQLEAVTVPTLCNPMNQVLDSEYAEEGEDYSEDLE